MTDGASIMLIALLCLVVLVSAVLIDYAHARCVVAISQRAAHRAALWSVVQWGGATVGFMIAVEVTFWVLPFEAAGLYLGTLLAVNPVSQREKPSIADPMISQRIAAELVQRSLSTCA